MKAQITEDERLSFTIDQSAVITSLSRDKIYRLIGEGQIVAKACGNRTLITRAELVRFIDGLPRLDLVNPTRRAGRPRTKVRQ